MKYRAIVFDDNQQILELLSHFLQLRGYEVHCYSDPSFCSLYMAVDCHCPLQEACADFIISDMNMIAVKGLAFLEHQLKKGCKIRRMALMSGSWNASEVKAARRIGCKIFQKPFTLDEIAQWLDQCETEISPTRELLTLRAV